MRWVWVVVTLAGIMLAVFASAAGWMALGILVAALGALAAALAVAQARIEGGSRAENLHALEHGQLHASTRDNASKSSR